MIKQPLIIPIKESGDIYRLYAEYTYTPDEGAFDGFTLIIPEGFEYDGASIPKIFWSLLGMGKDGMHRAAALVHDWLYIHKGEIVSSDGQLLPYTRKDADDLFFAMLKDASIVSWKAWVMYKAVRIAGQTVWKK